MRAQRATIADRSGRAITVERRQIYECRRVREAALLPDRGRAAPMAPQAVLRELAARVRRLPMATHAGADEQIDTVKAMLRLAERVARGV